MSSVQASGQVVGAVEIVEVSARDGLQNESETWPTADKIALVEAAIAAGARRLEVVSFVRPDAVPQMADAEEVMAGLPDRSDVQYVGLVLNRRGLIRAVEAGVDEINVVIAASNSFNRRNQNASTEGLLEMVEEVVSDSLAARLPASVTIATAFGCPFEGEVSPDAVRQIAEVAARAGAREIAIADTIGVGVPAQVRQLADVCSSVSEVPLRAHFHNTRNTGYANAMAALDAGITVLDSSIGGIGGCPFAPRATGNIATEDLHYLLARSGFETGLSMEGLLEAAALVEKRLRRPVPSMLSRAGDFAPVA